MAESPEPVAAPTSLLERFRGRDHTRGSILASVAVLSLPSILMSVVGFGTFQLIDLRFLSQLGSAEVAAAGAANQTLRQAFMLLILGLTVATQMMIARLVGEGRVEQAEHAAGQSFLLGAAIAALGAVTCGLFPEFFVALVTRDPEVAALGAIYVRIAFLTLGVMVSVQVFTSVLSGAGDSTTPMFISLCITPMSILAEWVLAFGHLGAPALGIAGIALGAALGGVTGAGVALWALFAGRCRVHLRARHLVPDPAQLRRLIALAWQPALHMVARTLIVVFFMALAGRLGGKVQAAYTIGLRVEMLAIMVAFPVANACATLVGQNLGAGDRRRVWQAVAAAAAVEAALLWPAAAALFLWRTQLVAWFASDPEVAAMATEYLGYSVVILLFYGFYFVAFRTLQAAGDMRTPMWISVSTALGLGAPLGYGLSTYTDLGASGMWMANFAYAMVNSALMMSWLLAGRWLDRAPRAAA